RGGVADGRLGELAERGWEEYGGETVRTSRQQFLLDCIEALPEHSRATLRLKYSDGMKVNDVAALQKRTPEAVMKALSRIRQALGECVESRRRLGGDES